MYACDVRHAMIQGLAMCQEEIIRCKVAANDFSARLRQLHQRLHHYYPSCSSLYTTWVIVMYSSSNSRRAVPDIFDGFFFLGRVTFVSRLLTIEIVGRWINWPNFTTIYFFLLLFFFVYRVCHLAIWRCTFAAGFYQCKHVILCRKTSRWTECKFCVFHVAANGSCSLC